MLSLRLEKTRKAGENIVKNNWNKLNLHWDVRVTFSMPSETLMSRLTLLGVM